MGSIVFSKLGVVQRESDSYGPEVQTLSKLYEAEADLLPAIVGITKAHRFDSFSYRVALETATGYAGELFEFTSMTTNWWSIYDKYGYSAVDPRLPKLAQSTVPLIWEQDTFRSTSSAVDIFLDVALAHGIGSGIAFPIHGGNGLLGMITLDSSIRICDFDRVRSVASSLGRLSLFFQYFHFLAARTARGRGIKLQKDG